MANVDENQLLINKYKTMLRSKLISRLSMPQIMEILALTQGEANHSVKAALYRLTQDAERRVATNALWVFTHFTEYDNEWLYAKHGALIDRCLAERDTTKLRLMLAILLRQPFGADTVRTDFIDFCLDCIADPQQPYAIRAQCIKLAYEQMKPWRELQDELRSVLELVAEKPLSPGLRSAWRQVMKRLKPCN